MSNESLFCNICHISFNSRDVLETHYKGKRHIKKERLRCGLRLLNVPIFNEKEGNMKSLHEIAEYLFGNEDTVIVSGVDNLINLQCTICNIAVEGIAQMTSHLVSDKHRKKIACDALANRKPMTGSIMQSQYAKCNCTTKVDKNPLSVQQHLMVHSFNHKCNDQQHFEQCKGHQQQQQLNSNEGDVSHTFQQYCFENQTNPEQQFIEEVCAQALYRQNYSQPPLYPKDSHQEYFRHQHHFNKSYNEYFKEEHRKYFQQIKQFFNQNKSTNYVCNKQQDNARYKSPDHSSKLLIKHPMENYHGYQQRKPFNKKDIEDYPCNKQCAFKKKDSFKCDKEDKQLVCPNKQDCSKSEHKDYPQNEEFDYSYEQLKYSNKKQLKYSNNKQFNYSNNMQYPNQQQDYINNKLHNYLEKQKNYLYEQQDYPCDNQSNTAPQKKYLEQQHQQAVLSDSITNTEIDNIWTNTNKALYSCSMNDVEALITHGIVECIVEDRKLLFKCLVCNIVTTGGVSMLQHVYGQQHSKQLIERKYLSRKVTEEATYVKKKHQNIASVKKLPGNDICATRNNPALHSQEFNNSEELLEGVVFLRDTEKIPPLFH